MKKTIPLLIALFMSIQIFAQDTVTVLIDNKKAAQCVITEELKETKLLLKKSVYKNYKTLAIQIKGTNAAGDTYKRDLEITGATSIMVSEVKDKPGKFEVIDATVEKQLLAGKTLKLYLLLNPSNPMLMIPSRRVYLGSLVMK